MGTATGVYSARTNHRIRVETQLVSQNIAGNYSTINFQVYSEKTSASTSYYLTAGGGGSFNIGGNTGGLPAWLYDFRSNTAYTRATGTVNVGHNPDGTGAYAFSVSDTAPGSLGSASASASEGLPTIPRASTPTFTPQPVNAGAVLTIATNPASAGFTHNLTYFFGAASGSIATGVGASTTWTVPLSLLNEIPSAVSGAGYIRTDTFSGGTLIGSTNVSLTVSAGAGIVPTFTSVTASENVSAVATIVGAYVQGLSKLNLAVAGAAGIYGSTISSYKIDVAGQTINAVSGVTPAVIAASGTVPVVAVITDSRGRTATLTLNLTFLAYAPPAIDAAVYSTKRALLAGTLSESGTYIRVDLKASSSSLLVGAVQKNTLTYKIYTRLRGDAAWTLKTTVTPGGVAFNSFDKVGIYAVENSWDVRVDVLDQFNTATIASTIATASIFMHWGPLGLGLGKFWETGRGAVDVKGQIYQNDGDPVISSLTADTMLPGRLRPTNNLGLAPNPDTLTSSGWYSGYNWAGSLSGYSIGTLQVIQYSADWITQVFILAGPSPVTLTRVRHSGTTWSSWRRTIQDDEGGLAEKLPLGSGWFWYHDVIPASDVNSTYSPPFAYRSSSGFVQVHGLLYNTNSPAAAGAVMLNLPAAYRPLQRWRGLVWASGNQMGVIVETNGDVKIEYALTGGGLVSLSGIKFNNDAGLARTAMTLLGAWVAMGVGEGTPRYALDGVGRVLLEGCIKNGLSSSDVWVPPGGYNPNLGGGALVHSWEQASANRLARFDIPASPLTSPYPLHSQVTASGTVTSTGRSLDFDYVRDGFGFNNAGMLGAWVNYGSGWNTAGYTKLGDGVVKAKGLISTGAMGTAALQTPLSYAPKYRLLFYADCTDAPGRIDIDPFGGVYPTTGANGFVSLEGLEWVPKNFTP